MLNLTSSTIKKLETSSIRKALIAVYNGYTVYLLCTWLQKHDIIQTALAYMPVY